MRKYSKYQIIQVTDSILIKTLLVYWFFACVIEELLMLRTAILRDIVSLFLVGLSGLDGCNSSKSFTAEPMSIVE